MSLIKKLFYLFLPLILGSIVGFLISTNIDYNELARPFLAPPKILFPIAWTIIYILLGISYYLYKKNGNTLKKIDILYYSSLIVNLLWSVIFFILKWRFIAVLWILLLDILVISLVLNFYQKNKLSAYLNIPYILWLLFATYLNIGMYILN